MHPMVWPIITKKGLAEEPRFKTVAVRNCDEKPPVWRDMTLECHDVLKRSIGMFQTMPEHDESILPSGNGVEHGKSLPLRKRDRRWFGVISFRIKPFLS